MNDRMNAGSKRSAAPARKEDLRDLLRATLFVGIMLAALIVNAVAG